MKILPVFQFSTGTSVPQIEPMQWVPMFSYALALVFNRLANVFHYANVIPALQIATGTQGGTPHFIDDHHQ